MKTLIATSIIALYGLAASYAHADVKRYDCAVQACKNANTKFQVCGMDKKRSTIVSYDYFYQVETYGNDKVTDVSSPALELDPTGKFYYAMRIGKSGDSYLFMKSASHIGFNLVNTTKREAINYLNCELLSVKHEKTRD